MIGNGARGQTIVGDAVWFYWRFRIVKIIDADHMLLRMERGTIEVVARLPTKGQAEGKILERLPGLWEVKGTMKHQERTYYVIEKFSDDEEPAKPPAPSAPAKKAPPKPLPKPPPTIKDYSPLDLDRGIPAVDDPVRLSATAIIDPLPKGRYVARFFSPDGKRLLVIYIEKEGAGPLKASKSGAWQIVLEGVCAGRASLTDVKVVKATPKE